MNFNSQNSRPFVDGIILQNKQHPYGIQLTPDNVRGLWTTKSQTHVIIHSQTGSPTEEWIKTATNKLVAKDHNVIQVNYTTVALQSYVLAYLQVPYIGGDACSLLTSLFFYKDLDGFKVNLIGYGLGAQVAGYVGRCFTESTEARIHKIIGLDPSVFLYRGMPTDRQLDATDALYVQTIHTSQSFYRRQERIVDAEITISERDLGQPICTFPTELFCKRSHSRAVDLYLESIETSQCKSYNGTRCETGEAVQVGIGYRADTTTTGSICIKIENKPPFCRE